MQRQADITIVGGGIAGLTLGLLLARAEVECVLIEPYPPKKPDNSKVSSKTCALFGRSIDILQETGVWGDALPYACPMQTMRIVDNGEEFDFYADEIGRAQFGYNIPNDVLRYCLYKAVASSGCITLIEGEKFAGYEADDYFVTTLTDGGNEVVSKLLVGADGRYSAVRDAAGISAKEQDYGQSALTFVINHSQSHGNISTEFHKGGGPLALVPLKGNQSSVVWVEKTAQAEALARLDKDALMQEFTAIIGDTLGGVTFETEPKMWPLCHVRAAKLTMPRVALAAEAAHVISPLFAQGLNLSLRDVKALSDLIVKARNTGGDLGSDVVLAGYAQARRGDIALRSMGVNGMGGLLKRDAGGLFGMRGKVMEAMMGVAPVKTALMREALG